MKYGKYRKIRPIVNDNFKAFIILFQFSLPSFVQNLLREYFENV